MLVLATESPPALQANSVLKTTEFPPGNQLIFPYQGLISSRFAPSAPIMYIAQDLPGEKAPKAMYLPSGDQCGPSTLIGGNESWSFSLPSTLLRHNTSSG